MAHKSPTIHFSCVSFREVILVTHQTEPENFTSIIGGILPVVPNVPGQGERKLTYPVERFQVHILVDNETEISFSCITELTDKHLLPFTFLETVKMKFCEIPSLIQRSYNACENEFDRDFAPVLAAVAYNFNTGQGDKLSLLETQVHDVRKIILNNVEKLIERSEKLDELVEKTEHLTENSVDFRRGGRELQRQKKCNNLKMWLVIGALLGTLLTIALLIASGVIRL